LRISSSFSRPARVRPGSLDLVLTVGLLTAHWDGPTRDPCRARARQVLSDRGTRRVPATSGHSHPSGSRRDAPPSARHPRAGPAVAPLGRRKGSHAAGLADRGIPRAPLLGKPSCAEVASAGEVVPGRSVEGRR
jgi:hypothetical protein